MKRLLKLLVIPLVTMIGGPVYAACNVSTNGLNFGPYDVYNTVSLDTTSTITVGCDEAPPPDVTISIGQSFHSGLLDPRQMRNLSGTFLLNYNLFTDAAKANIWGDDSGGTTTVFLKNVTKNKPRIVTVYGSIPPLQNATTGSYGDNLTVTIIW